MFRLLRNNQIANFIHDALIICGVLLIPWFFSIKITENQEKLTESIIKIIEVQVKNISHDYVRTIIDEQDADLDVSRNVLRTEFNGSRYLIIKLDNESQPQEE